MSRRSKRTRPTPQAPAANPLRMLAWDKLGFGLIAALVVALATGLVNLQIEKVRSRNAVRQEVAKVRFNKISEVWERLNQYEAAVTTASAEARRNATDPQWVKDGMPPSIRRREIESVDSLLRAAAQAQDRFWAAYHANRSYAGTATLAKVLEHYRYVRVIDLAESDELRQARLRAEVEARLHQHLPRGRDYTTPGIRAAEARLEATRQTAADIETTVLDRTGG